MAPARKRAQEKVDKETVPVKKGKVEETSEEKGNTSEDVSESFVGKENAPEEVAESSEGKENTPEEVVTAANHGNPTNVTVEHCKSWQVYKRNAIQLTEGIRAEFPDIKVELNPTKPRSKSFEITVTYDDGEELVVWTGVKKGPPRKLKFPELSEVLKEVKKNI